MVSFIFSEFVVILFRFFWLILFLCFNLSKRHIFYHREEVFCLLGCLSLRETEAALLTNDRMTDGCCWWWQQQFFAVISVKLLYISFNYCYCCCLHHTTLPYVTYRCDKVRGNVFLYLHNV